MASYRQKISGPLLDRIDMHIAVLRSPVNVMARAAPSERSAVVRERVMAARERQALRGELNARLSGDELVDGVALQADAMALFRKAVDARRLSARAQTKVLRVARTIGDLEGSDVVNADHVAEAVSLRSLE